MKRSCMLLVPAMVIGAVLNAQALLSVTIQGAGDSPLFDSTGASLTDNGLTFQLVVDTDNNTDLSGVASSGMLGLTGDTGFLGGIHSSALNDVVIGSYAWTYAGSGIHYVSEGLGYEHTFDVADSYSDDNYYIRWFNATESEAGYIYSSSSPWKTPANSSLSVPTREISYWTYATTTRVTENTGTMNGTSGWQTVAPVPEPTVLALLALGMSTLAVGRRKRG